MGIISVIGPDYTSTACSSEPGYTATGSAQILQCIGIPSNTLEYTGIHSSLLCKNHYIGESGDAFGCVPILDILIGARLRELSDEMRWIDRNDEIDGIEKIDQIELISRRDSQHSFEHQLVKRPVKRQICQKLVKS